MIFSSTPPPSRRGSKHEIPVLGHITLDRTGLFTCGLALLFTLSSYDLHSTLNYPEILLERADIAQSLAVREPIAALSGFVGLLLCGALLLVISYSLLSSFIGKQRRRIFFAGGIAGICWGVGGLIGLSLVPLWINAASGLAHVLAVLLLVLTETVAPVLLAFWALLVTLRFRTHRIFGLLGASGLLVVALRSFIWIANALLPPESGYYGIAGLLTIFALLGESLWLVWLFLAGFHLMHRREIAQSVPVQDGKSLQEKVSKGEENQ